MNTHLRELLARAEARETAARSEPTINTPRAESTRRITRSRGVVLAWSPTMNSNDPLSAPEEEGE